MVNDLNEIIGDDIKTIFRYKEIIKGDIIENYEKKNLLKKFEKLSETHDLRNEIVVEEFFNIVLDINDH
ncbi:MAG: hypothetical protein ACTSRI_14770 [Promethearchaeota archaeon]